MTSSRIFQRLCCAAAILGALALGCAKETGAPTLRTLVVTPATSKVLPQETVQLTATGSFSDGSTNDLSDEVTWTSSRPEVATVSDGGLVTGLTAGITQIDAQSGSVAGGAPVTVVGP